MSQSLNANHSQINHNFNANQSQHWKVNANQSQLIDKLSLNQSQRFLQIIRVQTEI